MSHKVTLTDGTVLTIPTPYLSHSQVDMYLRCPAQYEKRYILGHKEAPAWAMTEGSSGHSALEMNNLHKIETGADLPPHEVIEKYADELVDRVKNEQPIASAGKVADGDDIDASIATGTKSLGFYMEHTAPTVVPVTAERRLEFDVEGIPFLGFSDLETKGRIWDYKFTGSGSKKLQAPFVDEGLQFTLYAMGTGHKNVGVIGLVRDKPPKTGKNAGLWVRTLKGSRTELQKRQATALVVGVARAISAGIFPQSVPDTWVCTKRFCGYYPCWEKTWEMSDRRKASARKSKDASSVRTATASELPPPPRRKRRRRKTAS